jgi:hypothetical protein
MPKPGVGKAEAPAQVDILVTVIDPRNPSRWMQPRHRLIATVRCQSGRLPLFSTIRGFCRLFRRE